MKWVGGRRKCGIACNSAQIFSLPTLGLCGQSRRRWEVVLNSGGGGEKRDDGQCLNLIPKLGHRSIAELLQRLFELRTDLIHNK